MCQISSNKNNGSARVSQSVFETNSEYYSPSDLTLFQKQNGLTVQAAVDYNGYNTSEPLPLPPHASPTYLPTYLPT